MTKKQKTDLERLHDKVESMNPCSDQNDRGQWRKKLLKLEQGIKDENRDNY